MQFSIIHMNNAQYKEYSIIHLIVNQYIST